MTIDLFENYLHFHRKFGFPEPKKVTTKYSKMRLNFLLEELVETGKAAGYELVLSNKNGKDEIKFVKNRKMKVDLNEYVDGITDLLYVVLGTAAMSGLSKVDCRTPGYSVRKMTVAFLNVHKANMEKIPVKSAKQSKRGTKFDMHKPEGWKKPDHSELLK